MNKARLATERPLKTLRKKKAFFVVDLLLLTWRINKRPLSFVRWANISVRCGAVIVLWDAPVQLHRDYSRQTMWSWACQWASQISRPTASTEHHVFGGWVPKLSKVHWLEGVRWKHTLKWQEYKRVRHSETSITYCDDTKDIYFVHFMRQSFLDAKRDFATFWKSLLREMRRRVLVHLERHHLCTLWATILQEVLRKVACWREKSSCLWIVLTATCESYCLLISLRPSLWQPFQTKWVPNFSPPLLPRNNVVEYAQGVKWSGRNLGTWCAKDWKMKVTQNDEEFAQRCAKFLAFTRAQTFKRYGRGCRISWLSQISRVVSSWCSATCHVNRRRKRPADDP